MIKPFIPSLLIAEIFFPKKNEKGFTADIVEKYAAEGFYRSMEIGDGFDADERKRIYKAASENNITITQWLTFLIDKNQLDVSTLDSELRKKSVNLIKENLYLAAECGATNVAFVTGADPGVDKRAKAFDGLYESLCEVCEKASEFNLKVLVEPLDQIAHKKRVLGTTQQTVDLFNRVSKSYSNIGLAFDTAHAALNEENLLEALELGQSYIEQIHFSNAVLDPQSKLYGDFHMPLGSPGFLVLDEIVKIMAKAKEIGIKKDTGLRVAAEVRGQDTDDIFANEKETRKIMEAALNTFAATSI